jgi:Domain of unknown function (DUF4349)
MGNRVRRIAAGSLFVCILLLGASCSPGGRDGGEGRTDSAGEAPGPATQESPAAAGGGAGEASDAHVGTADYSVPPLSPRVIKNASLTLEVRHGTFDDRFQDATLVASRHGGFVAASRTQGSDRRSGTLVLRVPAAQFEAALAELAALGTVQARGISGEDVSARFVDLEARLRNWEAQESVLLGLMEEATSIQESITVQRTLQNVQLAIEEIRGQLRTLEDQTDMSTITLALSEPGAAPSARPGDDVPSISEAWNLALNGFLAVVTTVVITLGYVVPIALIALAGWFAYRRLRPRRNIAPAV